MTSILFHVITIIFLVTNVGDVFIHLFGLTFITKGRLNAKSDKEVKTMDQIYRFKITIGTIIFYFVLNWLWVNFEGNNIPLWIIAIKYLSIFIQRKYFTVGSLEFSKFEVYGIVIFVIIYILFL